MAEIDEQVDAPFGFDEFEARLEPGHVDPALAASQGREILEAIAMAAEDLMVPRIVRKIGMKSRSLACCAAMRLTSRWSSSPSSPKTAKAITLPPSAAMPGARPASGSSAWPGQRGAGHQG